MNDKKTFRTKILALTLGVALLGTAFGVALSVNLNGESATAEGVLTTLASDASTAGQLESPFKAVYNDVSKSVVGIQLNTQRNISNGRISSSGNFVGSGVVVRDDGYVITNYHVVTAGGSTVADSISVVYEDKTYKAEYVGGDAASDVAVLKVDDLPAPAVRLGNSDELSVGDWALVVGNPLGEDFTNTLTVGVVSGLNRDMTRVGNDGRQTGTTMIQTDAAINSGNSGGGLFNIRGELVGITSMKLISPYYSSATVESMGLAIPINKVLEVADEIIDYGEVRTPKMGVSIDTVPSPSDEPTKEYMPASAIIVDVVEGSPAEKAGLKVDDLILEVNGQRVRSSTEVVNLVSQHKVGDTVELKVYHIPGLAHLKDNEDIPEGEYLTIQVVLEYMEES